MSEAIEDGTPSGFTDDEHTARLAALWLLPEALRHHPSAASVMLRVLNDVDRSPSERLDFIDAHVVNRQRQRQARSSPRAVPSFPDEHAHRPRGLPA